MRAVVIFYAFIGVSFQVDVPDWHAAVPNGTPGVNGEEDLPDDTCQKLPCNFNGGRSCNYTLSDPGLNVQGFFKEWYHSSKLITNTALQLVNQDGEGKFSPFGGYALAQGLVLSRSQKYAMVSPKFMCRGGKKLKFKYHTRIPGSILQVCYYGKEGGCFFKFKIKKVLENWEEQTIALPATKVPRQIIFVARNLGQGAWVGVDDIQVVNKDGTMCKDTR